MITYKVYGKEACMAKLIEANDDLVHIAVFSSGVKIVCPALEPRASKILPPWRR